MRFILSLLILFGVVNSRAGTYVQFRTIYGDIDVELYDQDKPVTVQNFLRYVKTGAYRDTFFHRCVPGFVVQGGGFYVTNRTDAQPFTNVFAVPNFGPIPNEFGVGRTFSNTYGTIAMAKLGGDTNSASSQWFFNTVNNPGLDANDTNYLFVVFGKVLRGTNVLNGFNNRAYGFGMVNIANGVFKQLPVTFIGNVYPNYDELIYVDISLLNVQVKFTNSLPEISWNSVSGKTNQVQFTTNFPPVWQTLLNTNGTGETLKFIDSNSEGTKRFYRVIVDF
jgi:peptidyl-prolyl cis-trans isomerase A (cyclophilin A)